jgi:hypothetical protein
MTPSSRPSANRAGAGLVVVGCAGEDAESLHEALGALRQDGLDVELCEGLDHDPKRLSDAIDRHDSRGLYVLCRSPRLGRERVEALREILLARHVPFARTLTVAVGGRGALADRIRAGLRRASARVSGPNQAIESASGPTGAPRLVATSRSRPVATHATEDEEPTLVGKREPGAPDDGLGLEPSQPLLPPPPPFSPTANAEPFPPTAEISVVEAVDPDLLDEDTNASHHATAIAAADLDLSDLDNTGPSRALRVDTTAVGTPPALITGDTVIGPAPALITGDTVVGQKLPRALREAAGRWPLPPASAASPPPLGGAAPELEPSTMPLPRQKPPASPLPPPPPASLPPPPPPAASSAPFPATSGFDAPLLPPPEPSAAYSAPASLSAPSSSFSAPGAPFSAPAGTSTSHADAPVERGKALPWVLGGVALLLFILVVALAVSTGPDASEVAATDAPAADGAASTTPTPDQATPADEGAEADAAPEPPPVYPVVTALQARKVRALDVLLIATARGKPGDYSAAVTYCDTLEVEGLRGWRLPQIGELSSLAQANMIARGMFWSSTAADTFGDGHLAWNARRGHALPYAEDAVAVCVRGGTSGS